MTKRLLITADDYGAHEVIDSGILKCIEKGVLDCVDIMVTHDRAKESIDKLLEAIEKTDSVKPKLGLHLSLSCGKLQYEGDGSDKFKKFKRLIAKRGGVFRNDKPWKVFMAMCDLVDDYEEYLQLELEAQCKKFEDLTGLDRPTHVSSHKGVFGVHPKMYQMLSAFSKKKGMAMRCPTFLTLEFPENWSDNPEQDMMPDVLLKKDTSRRKKASCLVKAYFCIRKDIPKAFKADLKNGIISTDYFIEHFYMNSTKKDLEMILDKVGHNSYELVVHPVFFTDSSEYQDMPSGIKFDDDIMNQRMLELKTLALDVNLRELLEELEIKPYQLP